MSLDAFRLHRVSETSRLLARGHYFWVPRRWEKHRPSSTLRSADNAGLLCPVEPRGLAFRKAYTLRTRTSSTTLQLPISNARIGKGNSPMFARRLSRVAGTCSCWRSSALLRSSSAAPVCFQLDGLACQS